MAELVKQTACPEIEQKAPHPSKTPKDNPYDIKTSAESCPYIIPLNKILINSDLRDKKGQELIDAIVARFNVRGQNCFTTTILRSRGKLVPATKFRAATVNNKPEIIGPSEDLIARRWYLSPATTVEIMDDFEQTTTYHNIGDMHYLNVPENKYAQALINNNPVLYGPGVHIIQNSMFHFNPKKGLVNSRQKIIQFKYLVLIRHTVSAQSETGLFVKIGTHGYFLPPQDEPYVFDTKDMRIVARFFDASKNFIYADYKRLLLRENQIAITYDGAKKDVKKPQDKPIIISSPDHIVAHIVTDDYIDATFKFDNILSADTYQLFKLTMNIKYKIPYGISTDTIDAIIKEEIDSMIRGNKETFVDGFVYNRRTPPETYFDKYIKKDGRFNKAIAKTLAMHKAVLTKNDIKITDLRQ